MGEFAGLQVEGGVVADVFADEAMLFGIIADASKPIPTSPEPNTSVTTLALGKLLIHSIHVPVAELLPSAIVYGNDLGLFPIHPWGSSIINWSGLPIIPRNSQQMELVKNDYFNKLMIPLFAASTKALL